MKSNLVKAFDNPQENAENAFIYDGMTYYFNACECYDNDSLVRLPNNDILHIQFWLESNPPLPQNIVKVS